MNKTYCRFMAMSAFLMAILATVMARAQEPVTEQQETANQNMQTVQEVNNSLGVLIAFAQDENLAAKGYAPKGWVQPEFEVYEKTLGERPSLIPYDDFMRAVKAEVVRSELGAQYAAWVAAQPPTAP